MNLVDEECWGEAWSTSMKELPGFARALLEGVGGMGDHYEREVVHRDDLVLIGP